MDGRDVAVSPRAHRVAALPVRSRVRGAAVVVAMAAGVVATVATTPAPDPPCPTPSPTSEVSELYGSQAYDGRAHTWQPDDAWFEVGPFRGSVGQVEVESCILDHLDEEGRAPVEVRLDLTDDGSGPELESFLRAVLVIDGKERAWTVTDVEIREREGWSVNDLPMQEAHLLFSLPVDVPEPLVLRLPDLDGRNDPWGYMTEVVISPDPPDEAPELSEPDEPVESPDQTLPPSQRQP